MIGRLNHVAIAVRDISKAANIYRQTLGAQVSDPVPQPDHVCYEVDDIRAARERLKAQGARVLGDGEAKIGAHGKPVLFLHPKDFCGTLVEIEEA